MIEGSGSIPLTNGSGSRRPKNKKHMDPVDPDSDPDPQHWVSLQQNEYSNIHSHYETNVMPKNVRVMEKFEGCWSVIFECVPYLVFKPLQLFSFIIQAAYIPCSRWNLSVFQQKKFGLPSLSALSVPALIFSPLVSTASAKYIWK